MKVLLVPNTTKTAALMLTGRVASLLAAEGVELLMEEQLAHLIHKNDSIEYVETAQAYEMCDIVVTIGGDGTMLHTARHTMKSQKPMVGINTGRLGFLTIIEADELDKLRRLPRGEYTVENRCVIQAEFTSGKQKQTCLALNDTVLFKQAAEDTIALDILCDDVLISSFRGDGVVFATPTGSTAYSMSAGGPIVDARINAIIVTQLCAHIVHSPPMVFAGGRVLRAVPRRAGKEKIFLSCDGLPSVEVDADGDVAICQASITLPMIQFADADQLKSIDKKLKGR